MKIVADQNIVGLKELIEPIAQLTMVEGRQLTNAQLKNADALLVRSVTEVNRELLANTPVSFVGSATAGQDHIDHGYLKAAGIAFSAAPGSNANSVVEYVISALANIRGCLEGLCKSGSVGIVGFGQVGSLLAKKLKAMGISVIAYDPLLAPQMSEMLGSLEEVLNCSVVSLHTPLTRQGHYPSFHQFDRHVLEKLRADAVLINAGRGATLDNQALLELLQGGSEIKVVLDVWEAEPDINAALAQRCALVTPHIAGYSYDGKLAATSMVCRQLCKHFKIDAGSAVEAEKQDELEIQLPDDMAATIRAVINSVYDIRVDDRSMRKLLSVGDRQKRAREFDQLRKHYPQRREISCYKWHAGSKVTTSQMALLKALGCIT